MTFVSILPSKLEVHCVEILVRSNLSMCSRKPRTTNGFVVHLVARPLSMREVRGSKPCESNFFFISTNNTSQYFFLFYLVQPFAHVNFLLISKIFLEHEKQCRAAYLFKISSFNQVFSSFWRPDFVRWLLHPTKRSGAVEACWAHNPKVPGSKPGFANILFAPFALFLLFFWSSHTF